MLTKVGDAKNITEKATEEEKIQVEVAGAYDLNGNLLASKIEENIKNNIKDATVEETQNKFPVKVMYSNGHKYQITQDGQIMMSVNAGDTAPDDSNAVYISGDYTAIIPAGYTVSGTEGETSIENGLVVRDSNQNEWVWIPVSVSDLALMYTENQIGWTMLGTTAPNEVVTKYKTLATILGSKTINRTNPGLTASPYYREPDMVTGNGTQYDNVETNWTAAGFTSFENMATKLKDDYKDMINSIKENGGFYVGRYEIGKDTSNNPQEKAGIVMNRSNWYNLYKACKYFSDDNVESRMIWGCQWDQVCRFIKGNGANSVIDDSRSYGNYKDSTNSTDISGNANFNGRTGRSEYWKIKNIYDMAGNFNECTQEAYQMTNRTWRGRWKSEVVA